MQVLTRYSCGETVLSDSTEFNEYFVDEEGKIVITDYTPMSKYPDNCLIDIKYNGKYFEFGCDFEASKGLHTSEPYAMDFE